MIEENLENIHDRTLTAIHTSTSSNEASYGHSIKPLKSFPNRRRTMTNVVSKDVIRGASSRRKQGSVKRSTRAALLSILATSPLAMAQNCVSLRGSTQCPAFTSSSVDTTLTGLFPFLSYVSDRATFDTQLSAYVQTSYVQSKYVSVYIIYTWRRCLTRICRYQQLLGCENINLTNTTNLYARYTTTVICNSIIQNSKSSCNLTDSEAPPVCADSCAQFAESESIITADSQLCSSPSSNAVSQIRADFTNCALPADSLTGSCVQASTNEPDNCGFGNSTFGLCQYCGTGGQNSTDTCCYNSGADDRCAGVVLPTITGFITFSTSTASGTSAPTSTSTRDPASASHKGLSGGAIAGIVIGSIIGAIALIALIFLIAMFLRRKRGSQKGSILNQPSPARRAQSGMAYNPVASNATPEGYEVLPGGRIARMSALEGHSGGSSSPHQGATALGGAALGGAAGYAAGRRRHDHQSSSSSFGESPSSIHGGILRPAPNRRHGSLSSSSALGLDDPHSPRSGSADLSSPQGMASQQSEQLPFFKDYYSQDEIHPGDKVATLWAYQPRAGDEFALERGDMLKVVGIWDDGWATGVLINERADEWDEKRKAQRDSGVSNTSSQRDDSPNVSGEIKAFPLVCVCLPEHWRRTIEGDGSTESSGPPGPS
ncbi:SH3 domain-containing protein [Rutstroemia sp. NJR-2017a WRK4]|nr:SH3 domain-containing protein [Rutstroemia sp. NJR-2017a WRK4]